MIYTVDTYDFSFLKEIKTLSRGKGNHSRKVKYKDTVFTFDIESTNILDDDLKQAIMYIWQFQITEEDTIIGRTWPEFQKLIQILNSSIQEDKTFWICFIHNLSYEYQFIKSQIHIDECMAMDARKILKCVSGKVEFRCSYLHSNMSLDRYLKQMDVPDLKVKGFDYEKKRYPWTELTPEELEYCIHDVKGLREAILKELEKDNDTLYTFPLTSTGYSRREAKKALGRSQYIIRKILPDVELFTALRKAFRGGNTHANRYNANIIHESEPDSPIESFDLSSSYPSVLMSERYPYEFRRSDPDLLWLFLKHNQACLMHIYMEDVHLRIDEWGCPYIPKAKCESITGGIFDNGRVIQCATCEMYITEIDFAIILQEYDFQYQVLDLWTANKRLLPEAFRKLLLKTYKEKTELKGVDSYLYGKKKGLFNSYYGMMVQNPCKPEWILQENGDLSQDWDTPIETLIAKYQCTGWLPYQWGVWCTAYARLRLERGLQAIPPEAFLYCDTDSIKYKGNYGYIFDELNHDIMDPDLCAADPDGVVHYCGIYEKDDSYKRFVTIGAKKYAYEDMDGNIHVTISGVSKKLGAEELGCLENFKEGFTFFKAGGTESRFTDQPPISSTVIDGHEIPISSNVSIWPSTYTLSQTEEYKRLVAFLSNTDIRISLHYER